uniref:Xylulose kinase-1 n=1 Tax=Tanacetum cinerariifolium TaxID=118510 RepID=A0A699J9V1_TANCI|nr:hypothetical protein [Tanacetum cinerariifolium]
MAPLTFADTHNMIAFLSKSDASAGFDQTVDFLNTQVIHYGLMVNPTIYVSCIKQFWATASIKKVNDVVKFQALINKKKVVVTEDIIRQDLRLDDVDGVECFPTEEIFTELARMGYEKPPPKLTFYKAFFFAHWKFLIHTLVQCVSSKRTIWNEFSCSMASVVIYLATGRTFNFSKYVFDSMGRIERKDDDNAADKEVNATEPIVFDDEEVTMTMAQTLIKIKAKKARILNEQMAKRLHDEEVEQAAAREKQEQDDFKRAQELQRQYKIAHVKGMTYDQVRPIFEREYNKVQTFLKPDSDEEPTKKRVAKETLLYEMF